jgi:hypothetical protein
MSVEMHSSAPAAASSPAETAVRARFILTGKHPEAIRDAVRVIRTSSERRAVAT